MAFKKGLAAFQQSVIESKEKAEARKSFKHPVLKVADGCNAVIRILDNEPVQADMYDVYKKANGKVYFRAWLAPEEGSQSLLAKLFFEGKNPRTKVFFPVVVTEPLEEDEKPEEAEAREGRVYQLSLSFTAAEKLYEALRVKNDRDKKRSKATTERSLSDQDIVVSRKGEGFDTEYGFLFEEISPMPDAYKTLDLPDFEALYKVPTDDEVRKLYEEINGSPPEAESFDDSEDVAAYV